MKRLKYTALFIALSALTVSCGNDFLNLTPYTNANEEDFYRDKAEIETAMIAAYSTLHTTYSGLNVIYYFGALSSDDAYTVDQGDGAYQQFEVSQVRANNTAVTAAWNHFYASLTRMNKVIATAEGLDFAGKEGHIAEMKFLRALYYFNMVQIWGGVPLVTNPISIDEAYAMGRASVEDVYTQIIEDLQYGTLNLPDIGKPRAAGTPTKGSAYGLLGKVYPTKGDKANAATTLQNIYGKYALTPSYADLWDMNKKNGVESLFEIQYLGGTANAPSDYWAMFSPVNNVGAITLQGGGHNQVTDDLWNDYEAGDPRRDISIQDGWINLQGNPNPERFPIKWVDPTKEVVGKREAGNNNFIVLRYADVLLMLTEATGDAKYLNEVRARVGMPAWGSAGYPTAKYPTLALAIEHERRIELAMEFHRYFDIKRTGRAVDLLKASSKNNAGQMNSITVNNLSWPIPESVIDQNPGLWKELQNPGY